MDRGPAFTTRVKPILNHVFLDHLHPHQDDVTGYDFHVTERPMSRADAQLILTQLVCMNELLERLIAHVDTSSSGKKHDASQSSVDMNRRHQIIDTFIDERVEFTNDPDDIITTQRIYAEYIAWYVTTEPSVLSPLKLSHFGRYLTRRGVGQLLPTYTVNGQKIRIRTGIRFK